MINPTDEDLGTLCSGKIPVERHYDGSAKLNYAQTKLSAVLWLDLNIPMKEALKMILALDLVPDLIIEAVTDDLMQPETRPRQQPTFRQIAEKCWAAMLADKDLQQLSETRRLKHQARSGDQ